MTAAMARVPVRRRRLGGLALLLAVAAALAVPALAAPGDPTDFAGVADCNAEPNDSPSGPASEATFKTYSSAAMLVATNRRGDVFVSDAAQIRIIPAGTSSIRALYDLDDNFGLVRGMAYDDSAGALLFNTTYRFQPRTPDVPGPFEYYEFQIWQADSAGNVTSRYKDPVPLPAHPETRRAGHGMAVDSAGTIFYSRPRDGQLMKLPRGASTPEQVATPGAELVSPESVALIERGGGNDPLLVVAGGNDHVLLVTPGVGVQPVGPSLISRSGQRVAVDDTGTKLFVSENQPPQGYVQQIDLETSPLAGRTLWREESLITGLATQTTSQGSRLLVGTSGRTSCNVKRIEPFALAATTPTTAAPTTVAPTTTPTTTPSPPSTPPPTTPVRDTVPVQANDRVLDTIPGGVRTETHVPAAGREPDSSFIGAGNGSENSQSFVGANNLTGSRATGAFGDSFNPFNGTGDTPTIFTAPSGSRAEGLSGGLGLGTGPPPAVQSGFAATPSVPVMSVANPGPVGLPVGAGPPPAPGTPGPQAGFADAPSDSARGAARYAMQRYDGGTVGLGPLVPVLAALGGCMVLLALTYAARTRGGPPDASLAPTNIRPARAWATGR